MSEAIKEIGESEQVSHILNRFHDGHWKFISCGFGWMDLIVSCDKDLSEIDPTYKLYQIKEKYGMLRYYYSTSKPEESEEMNNVIRKYELMSTGTCEVSGKQDALLFQKRSYFKTLSPDVAESLGYNIRKNG